MKKISKFIFRLVIPFYVLSCVNQNNDKLFEYKEDKGVCSGSKIGPVNSTRYPIGIQGGIFPGYRGLIDGSVTAVVDEIYEKNWAGIGGLQLARNNYGVRNLDDLRTGYPFFDPINSPGIRWQNIQFQHSYTALLEVEGLPNRLSNPEIYLKDNKQSPKNWDRQWLLKHIVEINWPDNDRVRLLKLLFRGDFVEHPYFLLSEEKAYSGIDPYIVAEGSGKIIDSSKNVFEWIVGVRKSARFYIVYPIELHSLQVTGTAGNYRFSKVDLLDDEISVADCGSFRADASLQTNPPLGKPVAEFCDRSVGCVDRWTTAAAHFWNIVGAGELFNYAVLVPVPCDVGFMYTVNRGTEQCSISTLGYQPNYLIGASYLDGDTESTVVDLQSFRGDKSLQEAPENLQMNGPTTGVIDPEGFGARELWFYTDYHARLLHLYALDKRQITVFGKNQIEWWFWNVEYCRPFDDCLR